MPSSSRLSRPSDVNGTGVVSQTNASSAGPVDAIGRGPFVSGCLCGPRGERPPPERLRVPRLERPRSVVFEFKLYWLACAEGDDAPDRIVRRHADGYPIARNHLDAKASHSTAELGQHFVAGVALNTVKPAAVYRDHSALHVYQVVLAQLLAVLSFKQ